MKSIRDQIEEASSRLEEIQKGDEEKFYMEARALKLDIRRGYGRLMMLQKETNPRNRKIILTSSIQKGIHIRR